MRVFGLLGLCIRIRTTDVDDAISPASPKSSNQDVATVFRATILKEALYGWALLLLRTLFRLRSAASMDSWFIANCGGKEGLAGKVAQLVSNFVVP